MKLAVLGLMAVVMAGMRSNASAQSCQPPVAPFLPTDPDDIRAYADLLRRDFETYFAEAQAFFRCTEQERRAVFDEAQHVTDDYARMIEVVGE